MREDGETILLAAFGIIGMELLTGRTNVIAGAVAVVLIVFRIIMGVKQNRREQARREEEKEKRKEEKEEHELKMQLLRKEPDDKND